MPPVAPAIRQTASDAAVLRRVTGHRIERMSAAPGKATMKTPTQIAMAIVPSQAEPIGRWMVSTARNAVKTRLTMVDPSIAALKTAIVC